MEFSKLSGVCIVGSTLTNVTSSCTLCSRCSATCKKIVGLLHIPLRHFYAD